MDTINVRFKFTRELNNCEIDELLTKYNFIEKVYINRRDPTKCNISFSVPKFFSKTNAYLVKSQDFLKFKEFITNLFSQIMKSSIVYRVDTPFTYWMNDGEYFDDYSHIFYLLSHNYHVVTRLCSTKNFEETITQVKESFIMGDQSNLNKSNNKIIIYDQAKKLEDFDSSDNKIMFTKVKTEFPDIQNRIRIEVSRKTNISFENLDYSDQYSKAYKYLENTIFDKDAIGITLEMFLDEYKEAFVKHGYYPDAIIYSGRIFEYGIYRNFLKEITSNNKTLETRITRARKILDDLTRSALYKITLKKVLTGMQKEFKKQITW